MKTFYTQLKDILKLNITNNYPESHLIIICKCNYTFNRRYRYDILYNMQSADITS